MKVLNTVKTNASIHLSYSVDGETRSINIQRKADQQLFDSVSSLIDGGMPEEAVRLLDRGLLIEASTKGRIRSNGGKLFLEGKKFPDALSDVLFKFASAGVDPVILINFWERLMKNPTPFVREQLFSHVKHNGVMLLPDGRFVLYKRVRTDMTSHHDKKTKHVVGEYLRMPRSECDSDPLSTCGPGLHAAPHKHANKVFGHGPFLRIICDPEHAVSCPRMDSEKIRFCEYYVDRVLGEREGPSAGIDASTVADLDKFMAEQQRGHPEKSEKIEVAEKVVFAKAVVSRTTDRVTIPSEIMLKAGFVPSQQAVVVLTDPRSRFLVVTCQSVKPRKSKFISKPLVLSSTGSFSIRDNLLAHAKINDVEVFEVSITGRLTVEVRRK